MKDEQKLNEAAGAALSKALVEPVFRPAERPSGTRPAIDPYSRVGEALKAAAGEVAEQHRAEAGVPAAHSVSNSPTAMGDRTPPYTPLTPPPVFRKTGYEELQRILKLAHDQSATGKGKERHAYGPLGFQPWHHQPILANARQVGPGGPANQVMKKVQEAVTMAGNKNFAAARAECLGAIVYAAAMFKLLEEMENPNNF